MKSYTMISMINGLYDQLVHRTSHFTNNQGLMFSIQVRAECMGYEADGNTHHLEWEGFINKWFNVIILNGHQVFTQITDESVFKIPQTGWKNTTNHDSCWRSGCDALTSLGFDCHDEAFKNCPKEYRPQSRDEGVNFRLGFGLSGPIFKLVEVKKELDFELDSSGYHTKITSVKVMKSRLIKDLIKEYYVTFKKDHPFYNRYYTKVQAESREDAVRVLKSHEYEKWDKIVDNFKEVPDGLSLWTSIRK